MMKDTCRASYRVLSIRDDYDDEQMRFVAIPGYPIAKDGKCKEPNAVDCAFVLELYMPAESESEWCDVFSSTDGGQSWETLGVAELIDGEWFSCIIKNVPCGEDLQVKFADVDGMVGIAEFKCEDCEDE